MKSSEQPYLDAVAAIDAVPRILEVVCRTTGLGFAAVARVTDTNWICCASRDEIGFGLGPGGELPLLTTICNEIRQSGSAVVIDHVAQDETFRHHPAPALYGFQSYISVPIVRKDGRFWGTLCAIDPKPAHLQSPEVRSTFDLFAELIASHLDSNERLLEAESTLRDERQQSTLREQFIAVLGHDLRSPLQTLATGLQVLERAPERSVATLALLKRSTRRMGELVDNILDFARTRLGGGLAVTLRFEEGLSQVLQQVVDELRSVHPTRRIDYADEMAMPLWCEAPRLAQLASNLLSNALKYGSDAQPVRVRAVTDDGGFELTVTNSGADIPEVEQQRLFEPYVRGTGRSDGEGLGLGLYIVAEIARAHGGAVSVDSADGLTTFTFRMPLDGRPLLA